jgi:hypothetical protein
LFFVVVAMFVLMLIRNNNIVNLINVFVVAFLIYFVISKRSLIMFFETFICLRNLFRLCLFKILFFLSHIRTYVIYLLEMRHCRCNLLISLIIFVHFVVYLSLTLLYNFAYEIKSLIVFFKASSNFVVYLLMLSLFIKSFNINSNNKFLNMLSNFFKFIAFQFCLKRR